mmetsp:Transcript_1637/g.2741  ORF Transcript_1637/g.2741 Transcript_1637/m.2741 type:complete len:234 (-) Transcript_1637:1508-2209(-)
MARPSSSGSPLIAYTLGSPLTADSAFVWKAWKCVNLLTAMIRLPTLFLFSPSPSSSTLTSSSRSASSTSTFLEFIVSISSSVCPAALPASSIAFTPDASVSTSVITLSACSSVDDQLLCFGSLASVWTADPFARTFSLDDFVEAFDLARALLLSSLSVFIPFAPFSFNSFACFTSKIPAWKMLWWSCLSVSLSLSCDLKLSWMSFGFAANFAINSRIFVSVLLRTSMQCLFLP